MIELSIKGEMTARTVIGPDPTLKMGQICVPPQIASNLTIPVQVTHFNIKYLSDLVDNGKVNYVLKDNGQTRINLENALFFKGTRLNHGDIIFRKNKITGEEEEIFEERIHVEKAISDYFSDIYRRPEHMVEVPEDNEDMKV
jgi:DNA-directed RNA polymerase beta' subunit